MNKTATLLAAAGIAVFGLAACGSDDDSSSSSSDNASTGSASTAETTSSDSAASTGGGSGSTLTIAADPNKLAFTTDHVNAKAGPTTIELDNPSSIPHELEVKSADGEDVGEVDEISQSTGSFQADLKPGEYTFVCNLPGHAATMHGTITVK